jgi:protein-S-isoprenylcysteine O-methyltransferase Ste14
VTAAFASSLLWDVWIVTWLVAAFWTRRTAARPPLRDQALYLTPTILGGLLLFEGSNTSLGVPERPPLWTWSPDVQWVFTGLIALGLGFTWWARVTIGSLWSGSVVSKEGQAVVRSGPYGIVRHPIYTGILLGSFAGAIQIGQAANLVGAGLLSLGFWLKARLEERFLSVELGDAYADYRRRTPMLAPFWPIGR